MNDVLIVRTHITELRRAYPCALAMNSFAKSDGVVIAEGETGHVVTDANGRVRSMPQGLA